MKRPSLVKQSLLIWVGINLAIFKGFVVDVVDGRVATLGPGVRVKAGEDVLAHVKVEGVLGGLSM